MTGPITAVRTSLLWTLTGLLILLVGCNDTPRSGTSLLDGPAGDTTGEDDVADDDSANGDAVVASTVIVDTGQEGCYDDAGVIECPEPGAAFHGQDAQYAGNRMAYQDNGDGTVLDLVTGLIWQQSPDFDNQRTWAEAQTYADSLQLAGQEDWRLPTIKELYSLIAFYGNSRAEPPVPYIDTDFFDFQYPDTATGDRLIDVQFWSSTEYVGTTMQGDATAFGVNFADGRIKGYPTETGPDGTPFARYVRCVRGGDAYGVNDFADNGDGTITDRATGLMWTQTDSGTTLNWEQALEYAETLERGGHADWRLPNAKELQSIVDYTRAPDALDAARRGPAIDPIFDVTAEESWFWASTTHLEAGDQEGAFAVYVCFGQAFGILADPLGNLTMVNVHGAGAQRSDPKSGDPEDPQWAGGFGPQGDEIRILNYVRCVRDLE